MMNARMNDSRRDLDSLGGWRYYQHHSVSPGPPPLFYFLFFALHHPLLDPGPVLSPTLSVSHPRSLSHSVPLAASGCLSAVPLPMCQGAHWADNTYLMYVRGRGVYARGGARWSRALLAHVRVYVCVCVTCYKCLSCPFLCARSPKHPLLHLQSGPRATILTAEAGREGQLKQHTHARRLTHTHARGQTSTHSFSVSVSPSHTYT